MREENSQTGKHRHQQQQEQPSLNSKIFGDSYAMDPQKTSQGWPHVFFNTIQFYSKSYTLFSLPLPFFVPST